MTADTPALNILPTVGRRTFVRGAALLGGSLALGASLDPTFAQTARAAEAAALDELTLGVVSFQPVWGDADANLDAMRAYVDEAAEQGVDLLLFPEMCVTGYVSTDELDSEEAALAVGSAEAVDGPTAQLVSGWAQESGMWICYGATETVEGDDEHAYNSVFACAPDGTVSTYQKIHPVEGAWCTPGETPMVLDTAWGPVGVNICYDTYAIPELERAYAARGCRLVLNPTATSRGYNADEGDATSWQWYFESRVKNIAIRDQIFLASANLAGYDGSHYTFPGGSCAFGPTDSTGDEAFCKVYVGDTADAEPGLHVGVLDLSLATATDVMDSDVYRSDLFATWYDELAEQADDDLAAAPGEQAAVVGTVNFQPTFGDKEANFQSMAAYIEQAAEAGVQLLVFPEMALTGYAWCDSEDAANARTVVQIAEAQDGPYATQLSELAVEHGMYVVFGTSEPVEGDDDHAYNSAFVCTPEGEVLAYRKVVPVEGPWCVAGTEPLVVETPFGALGLSICKDTYAAPEIARYYAARGCTYLLNPTARTGTAAGWEDLYRNAIENLADQDKMIVVSADLCGADLDAPAEQADWDPYTGASAVVAPLGSAEDSSYVRVWGSLSSDPSACGLVVAEVDYEDLWLGLGGAIYFFNPELYAALYRGAEFECTTADLSAA